MRYFAGVVGRVFIDQNNILLSDYLVKSHTRFSAGLSGQILIDQMQDRLSYYLVEICHEKLAYTSENPVTIH